jgi:hypothetical protein
MSDQTSSLEPNAPTTFKRLCAWLVSTDPLPMTPQKQRLLLGALASPAARRTAKLAALASIAGLAICLTLIVPFATAILGVSERYALAVVDATVASPGLIVCTVSVPIYALSSALWHAGFSSAGAQRDANE